MTRTAILFTVLLVFCSATLCDAQVSPGGALQQSIQTLEELRREQELRGKREEKGVIEETEPGAREAPVDESTVIFVKKIEVEGAKLIPEKEIRAITGKFEGREVSIGDLNRMLKEINALYKYRGYLAQAVFPAQDVSEGIVRIRVVEGRIGKIEIENNRHTRNSYIAARFSAKSGDPVNLKELEKELLYFNITNDVKLRAELRPGTEVGETNLHLVAYEPPNFSLVPFTDNSGRAAWGLHRLGFMMAAPSVFGYRDAFSFTGLWAEGLLAGSLSYSFPITRAGTRFGVRYDRNEIDVIGGPLDGIQDRGNASDLAFFLTHPILVKPKYQLTGFLEFHGKRSESIFALPVLSEGELITRLTDDVRSTVFGLELQSVDESGAWVVRSEFTKGFHDFGGDKDYFKYNLLFLRQQRLGDEVILVLKGAGQATPDELLPGIDQFLMGGISSLPGYPEGLRSGDNGYYVNVELDFPIFPSSWEFLGGPLREKVKGAVFVDHGGAFPGDEPITHREFLGSAGFGLLLNFSKRLSGKVLVGFPFEQRIDVHDTARVHFFLQSALF